MPAEREYRVGVINGQSTTVQLNPHDLLNFNRVATDLGVSIATLRRMISSGEFPQGNIFRGNKTYWMRNEVRTWLKLRNHFDGRNLPARERYKNLDRIDCEEEREFSRKPIDFQSGERFVDNAEALLARDPDAFVEQHPKLKKWARDKTYLKKARPQD